MVKKQPIVELGNHIEMEHERELPGLWDFITLIKLHKDMHNKSDHWNHEHVWH